MSKTQSQNSSLGWERQGQGQARVNQGPILSCWGSPNGPRGKEFACNAGDPGLIPGSRRSPGEGNGNPLQYPCLENPIDKED